MFWEKKNIAISVILNIGDQYLDKKWEDTIIEITRISNPYKAVRYKFIQRQKLTNLIPTEYEMSWNHLLGYYTKIEK